MNRDSRLFATTIVGLVLFAVSTADGQVVPWPAGGPRPPRPVVHLDQRGQPPTKWTGPRLIRRLPPVESTRIPMTARYPTTMTGRPTSVSAPPAGIQPGAPASIAKKVADGATVHGRLSDRGRPLRACRVAIVSTNSNGGRYRATAEHNPFVTTTNQNGEYTFENVPLGDYKLTWLPAGTRQWIRRIALKPDVRVRDTKEVWMKEIRIAMHTVN